MATNGKVAKADVVGDATSFYEVEENLAKLCDFLRSNEGPTVREAIEMDKRVYYLKGKSKVVAMTI